MFDYSVHATRLMEKIAKYVSLAPKTVEKKKYAHSYQKLKREHEDVEIVPFAKSDSRKTRASTIWLDNTELGLDGNAEKVIFHIEHDDGEVVYPEVTLTDVRAKLMCGDLDDLPKNIIVDADFDFGKLAEWGITEKIQSKIEWAICIRCSGRNIKGFPCYLTFASFNLLKHHAKRHGGRRIM
jgi:hypothetical protein